MKKAIAEPLSAAGFTSPTLVTAYRAAPKPTAKAVAFTDDEEAYTPPVDPEVDAYAQTVADLLLLPWVAEEDILREMAAQRALLDAEVERQMVLEELRSIQNEEPIQVLKVQPKPKATCKAYAVSTGKRCRRKPTSGRTVCSSHDLGLADLQSAPKAKAAPKKAAKARKATQPDDLDALLDRLKAVKAALGG